MLRKSKLGTNALHILDNTLCAVQLCYYTAQRNHQLPLTSEIFKGSYKQTSRFLKMPLFDNWVLDNHTYTASICLTVSVL